MTIVGTLASIWRYPVKSLRGESLERVAVGASGIPGDRERALFVRSGHAREGKTYRGKEHDRLHLTSSIDDALAMGRERGVALERRAGGGFFDAAPISVLLDHWLDEVSAAVGYAVEPERFRPNFFVHARSDFTAREAELEGAEMRLGTVSLRVRGPIVRCVTPTYHLGGEAADPGILRFLAQRRNVWMGVYCDVSVAGDVRAGDVLVLESEV